MVTFFVYMVQRCKGEINLNTDERAWIETRSNVKVCVKWLFGDIENHLRFIVFNKYL